MDYLQYLNSCLFNKIKWLCFKPYYKWITFNTCYKGVCCQTYECFKPYYKWITFNTNFSSSFKKFYCVLNLIINGLPSIPRDEIMDGTYVDCFKPYYKWITFNTYEMLVNGYLESLVLNLIINGLPSIHQLLHKILIHISQVLNLIINGLPSILLLKLE